MNSLLKLAGSGMIAGAIALSASAASAQTVLTLTSINAPNHWSETEGHVPFMACVKESSKGAIDFKYFHTSQIATVATTLDAVQKGTAQIGFIAPTSVSDKMPFSNIPILPAMGDSVQQMTKAFRKVAESGGPFTKEFADLGIRPLIINLFPPYQMMSRRDGLKTADSFRNKKIRVAGGAQTFGVTALNGAAVTINFGDIYMALQQGTIDAYIFSSIAIKPLALQEVTKAMSRNGNFGGAVGIIGMDVKAFNALPADQQKVLVDCGLKSEEHLAKYADENDGKLFDEFAKLGVDVFNYTDKEKAAINEKMKLAQKDYVDRLQKRGIPAQAAYDEFMKALQ